MSTHKRKSRPPKTHAHELLETLQLKDYMDLAMHRNYMISVLITSSAEAKIPSLGMDYGVGKSTVALQMANECYAGNWNKVKENCIATPYQCKLILDRPYRTNCFLWDDMQMTVGKHQAHNPDVREFVYYLTTQRPYFAVMIGTTPHRGMLQKDFREFFHFEVIVPVRGVYEVQQLRHLVDFDDPRRLKDKMRYKGEALFLSLSKDIQEWYTRWRHEQNLQIRKRLKIFSKWEPLTLDIHELSKKEMVVFNQIKEDGHRHRRTLWHEGSRGLAERMRVKGFLEREGDFYVLTKEAQDIE